MLDHWHVRGRHESRNADIFYIGMIGGTRFVIITLFADWMSGHVKYMWPRGQSELRPLSLGVSRF